MPAWLSYVVGCVIAVLIALLLAPLIPSPGDQIVAVIAWIVAAILAILALVALLRMSAIRGNGSGPAGDVALDDRP